MNLISARTVRQRRRQAGSAVVVVLALLVILLIYVAGNIRTLDCLGRDLRLLERQQTQRLQSTAPATNLTTSLLISTNSPGRHSTTLPLP
jgi:hypothetical protein